VLLYERWMNNELMAGNYVVRASAWGIKFCDGWAGYDTVDQPRGYHSSDNGAIHMHVLRILRISKHVHCAYWWERLSQGAAVLDEYFNFVSCTRLLMGAPRRWKLEGKHRVTIIPRGHAWAIDGGIVNSKISSIGAVMHHGQKTTENYLQYFKNDFVHKNHSDCPNMMRDDTFVDKKSYCGFLMGSMSGRMDGGFLSMARIAPPPWDQAYVGCMQTLTCKALDDGDPLELSVPRPLQRAPLFLRLGKDLKFEQCSKEHGQCKCTGIVKFGTKANAPKEKSSIVVVGEEQGGKVQCNLESFDNEDPAPGDSKQCYCAASETKG